MKPILVFQTDFTYKEGAVSSMYGVVKSVDRELEIIDGTHELPQYDTWSASYRLYQALPFWPEGTIYISVVDPGVGTSRRGCVCRTSTGHYVVTPDNGTLTHIDRYLGIEEVRQIDESVNRLRGKGTEESAVFHGRDVFGYTAARLASGIIDFEGVGPAYPVSEIVRHKLYEPDIAPGKARGILEIDDPNFGNLWTNIPTAAFKEAGFGYGEELEVRILHDGEEAFQCRTTLEKSFGFVEKGKPLVYNNELQCIALAVSQGSFIRKFGIGYGPEWVVEFTKLESK